MKRDDTIIPTVIMRTTLFARCRCKKIVEVKILWLGNLKSFRIYGTCPHCSKKVNRLAFKYGYMCQRAATRTLR